MLQMAKIDYFLTIKYGTQARDELISLRKKLDVTKLNFLLRNLQLPKKGL